MKDNNGRCSRSRRPYWPPTYKGLETPEWLYAPSEAYPPDLISERDKLRFARERALNDDADENAYREE